MLIIDHAAFQKIAKPFNQTVMHKAFANNFEFIKPVMTQLVKLFFWDTRKRQVSYALPNLAAIFLCLFLVSLPRNDAWSLKIDDNSFSRESKPLTPLLALTDKFDIV